MRGDPCARRGARVRAAGARACFGFQPKAGIAAKRFILAPRIRLRSKRVTGYCATVGRRSTPLSRCRVVLNLVEPQSSGIGGGAFNPALFGKRCKLFAYDGRETAPAAARAGRFIGADGRPLKHLDAIVGGRSVGTPGVLRALEFAHAKHGKLPWAELFQPAIRLAAKAFHCRRGCTACSNWCACKPRRRMRRMLLPGRRHAQARRHAA